LTEVWEAGCGGADGRQKPILAGSVLKWGGGRGDDLPFLGPPGPGPPPPPAPAPAGQTGHPPTGGTPPRPRAPFNRGSACVCGPEVDGGDAVTTLERSEPGGIAFYGGPG